jgi:hypothetical protein
MSFILTTQQFKNKTKTVTRRFGWHFLRLGDIVCGVEKCMGFKKGEKIKRLGLIRIVSVCKVVLSEITQEDCAKEGFPDMIPAEFVQMLCNYSKCFPYDSVNRIEFEYV